MDLFEKCYRRSHIDDLREQDLFPYFRELQSRQDTEVIMEGRRRIMLGSNNYLGLTTQPEVMQAGLDALRRYGTGCSGSRLLNGTLELHLTFEREMAAFLRKEDVVSFSTGFQSNLGIISASPTPVGSATAKCSATAITIWPIWRPSCKRCRKRPAA